MAQNTVQDLTMLRACVAFIGEKEQSGWWPSSFLSISGEAFLSPVFPKTSTLARVNGASGAAQSSHDDQIGIGDVYHLFRLPENIERDISEFLSKDATVLKLIESEESARACLLKLSSDHRTRGVGPLLIDQGSLDKGMIGQMAAAYLHGFSAAEQVYPYYRGKA